MEEVVKATSGNGQKKADGNKKAGGKKVTGGKKKGVRGRKTLRGPWHRQIQEQLLHSS